MTLLYVERPLVVVVQLLKEAGATEVHVAIGSPALAYPCFYGIDIQTRQELIAANHTVEETRQIIGADSLTYLSVEGLIDSIGIETDAPMVVFALLTLTVTTQHLSMTTKKTIVEVWKKRLVFTNRRKILH